MSNKNKTFLNVSRRTLVNAMNILIVIHDEIDHINLTNYSLFTHYV